AMTGAMSMKKFFAGGPMHRENFALVFSLFGLMLAVMYVLTAIVTLWATLGLNRPWPRLAAAGVTAVSAALLPLLFIPFDDIGTPLYVASCSIQAVVVAIVLLVARSAGYRLVPLAHLGGSSGPADLTSDTLHSHGNVMVAEVTTENCGEKQSPDGQKREYGN